MLGSEQPVGSLLGAALLLSSLSDALHITAFFHSGWWGHKVLLVLCEPQGWSCQFLEVVLSFFLNFTDLFMALGVFVAAQAFL